MFGYAASTCREVRKDKTGEPGGGLQARVATVGSHAGGDAATKRELIELAARMMAAVTAMQEQVRELQQQLQALAT